MKKRWKIVIGISLFSLCACNSKIEPITKFTYGFDTVTTTTLYANEEKTFKDIESIITTYSKLFDAYKSYEGLNNVFSINTTNEWISISNELFLALKEANTYLAKTNGLFNPYIGNLSKAWKNALANNIVLDSEEITTYVFESNSTDLSFDESTLRVRRNGTGTIDLGAFAKGYVLSIIKNYLNENNVSEYLIDSGSSSILLGNKPNDKNFNVGLKYIPGSYLSIRNTSIGTSSIYEQLREIDGIKYSHIINPFNGNVIPSYDFVMVINDDPIYTDVFSTALMNMSIEQIKAFDQDEKTQVIVSKDRNIIYKSSSLDVRKH